MSEVRRVPMSVFKGWRMTEIELPVIVTRDGEDVYAVVELGMFEAIMAVQSGRLSEALAVMPVVASPVWQPPDLARDT